MQPEPNSGGGVVYNMQGKQPKEDENEKQVNPGNQNKTVQNIEVEENFKRNKHYSTKGPQEPSQLQELVSKKIREFIENDHQEESN